MAKARKDNKGRALRKGESQRKSDLMYIYTYTDSIAQKRRYVYSKDLMQLREKEKKLVYNQLDGLDIYAADTFRLNYLFERYISTKVEVRESTFCNYIYLYNHFVRDTLGKKKVGEIRYSDILCFYLYLLKEKNIQISTLQTIHVVLHPVFEMAVKDNIIRTNPTDGVMKQVKRKTGLSYEKRKALTIEQQRSFMTYVANSPFFCRWTPLFTVLLGTGCRIGEIIGLRWCDVNFDERMININHSMIYYQKRSPNNKHVYQIALPKTVAGIRNVPMMQEVYDAFKEEATRQAEEGIHCTAEVDGMSDFIFCNQHGRLLNSSWINKSIRRILKYYNEEEKETAEQEGREPVFIPNFTCHIFRHTFISRYCENETNVKVIQSVVGHADYKTTMNIYAEITEKKKLESIENLSRNMHIF